MSGNRNSGRRPKPTEILRLQGTYRPKDHEHRANGPQATGHPARPSWLRGEARRFWERVIPQLVEMGVAKKIDRDDLAAMCEWWAAWRANIQLAATDASAMIAATKAYTHFQSLADRFGMNPSARIKLAGIAPQQKQTEDPALKYLG